MSYHSPVLLEVSIDALVVDVNGIYVDCTFGGGGHSKKILEKLDSNAKLIGFDQDKDAYENKLNDPRFEFVMQNFRHLKANLKFLKITQVDGILADFGVSSHQFDTPERGFSTRFEGNLDMRMNQNAGITAKDILNTYDEDDLAKLFKEYGELINTKRIARDIVLFRQNKKIETINELKSIFFYISPIKQNKFFAQLFQALRIVVNDELEVIKELLLQAKDVLKPNGRLVVISYHSLEDRLVKKYFRNGMFEGEPEKDVYGNYYTPFKASQSKVIVPTEEEIMSNPRARSAKMRIGIKN